MKVEKFDDLITLGQVKKVITIGGHDISMHTLSSLEYSRVTDSASGDLKMSDSKKMELIQRNTLVNSIDSIDGEKLSDAEKQRILGFGQLAFSNALFNAYIEMIEAQGKILEDAKKNSSQTEKPAA